MSTIPICFLDTLPSLIPLYLQGIQLYLVFECVWLEDGIKPEYKFLGAFQKEDEASNYLTQFQKKDEASNYLTQYHKIISHKMVLETTSIPLAWNNKYNCWTDNGAFTCVTINEIVQSLGNSI